MIVYRRVVQVHRATLHDGRKAERVIVDWRLVQVHRATLHDGRKAAMKIQYLGAPLIIHYQLSHRLR